MSVVFTAPDGDTNAPPPGSVRQDWTTSTEAVADPVDLGCAIGPSRSPADNEVELAAVGVLDMRLALHTMSHRFTPPT